MTTFVAFFRGINVGTAKRIPMQAFREVFTDLGCTDVVTILNSGNVVFDAAKAPSPAAVQAAVEGQTGVRSRPTIVAGAVVSKMLEADPLRTDNPSRTFVAIPADAAALRTLRAIAKDDWAHETIAVGSDAAYLWCPDGGAPSKLWKAVTATDTVTTRNRATMEKIGAVVAQR